MTAGAELLFAQGYDLTAFTLAPVTTTATTGVEVVGTPVSILLYHKQSDFSNSPELVNIENSTQHSANMVTRRNINYRLTVTELMIDQSAVTGGAAIPSVLWQMAGPNAVGDAIQATWSKGGVVYVFIGRIENLTQQSISGENAAVLTLAQIALTTQNPTMTPNA